MNPKDFLQKIVSIHSPSGREGEVAQFVAAEAQKLGFTETKVDRFNNAVLRIGSNAKKTIVLLGHLDTVEPFLSVKLEKNILHGRGAVDAKGAFATFVFAALAASQKLENTQIIVAGAAGEEKDGAGARVLAEKLAPPSAVIVGEPSGVAGITLGYKGVCSAEYFQRKAMLHSANLSAQNVIEDAIAFTEKIRRFAEKFNIGKTAWTGLQQRVEKFVYDEVNGVEQVKTRVKFRTPLGFDHAKLKKVVDIAGRDGEVDFLQSWGSEEACLSPKNTPVVRAFLGAIRAAGEQPVFKVKTGTSDMNTFMKAFPDTPMVSYGPGDSNLDHTPEERIDLPELEKAIAVLTSVLLALDQSL